MSWNVRGLNFDKKWKPIRDKILESKSDIVYLQETEKESFGLRSIKNICPRDFTLLCSSYQWEPQGGYWLFSGTMVLGTEVFQNDFPISVEHTSKFNNDSWILTTIYAPCTPQGKRNFLEWFRNI